MRQSSGLSLIILLVSLSAGSADAQDYIDLTLDRAVEIALNQNRDIIQAKEETARADFRITEAASAAYPQVNGSWTFDKNLKPQVFVISFPDSAGRLQKNRLKIGTDHSLNIGANLTQPIWVGGKVGTALEAAKIYKKMSGETFESVQQNVVTGVASGFYIILLAHEMVGITRESLELAEKHLDNVQVLHDAGAATDYDLLRARVHVANIKPDLLEAENNVKIAMLRFRDILGIDPATPLTVSGALSEPDTTLFSLTDHETALSKRPDFKATEYNVDLQQKAVRIALGDFLPTITAGTTFAYSGMFDTFKYDAEDWNPYWYANVSVTFPIFTGFRNYSLYKQAKVDYRKAQTSLRKTRNSIVIEVDEGVMNLRNACKQIDSQSMNVREAEKAVQIAESLYANGRATQLEVLDAQLALEVSKTNRANVLYEGKVAEISLKKSLGLLDVDNVKGNLQ